MLPRLLSPLVLQTMAFFDVKSAEGRFEGVTRAYTAQDVQRLRGSVKVENTLAQRGADKLWELLKSEPYVHALGALSGNQVGPKTGKCGFGFGGEDEPARRASPGGPPRAPPPHHTTTPPPCCYPAPPDLPLPHPLLPSPLQAVQMAKAGLKAIYLSGWQVGRPPCGLPWSGRPPPDPRSAAWPRPSRAHAPARARTAPTAPATRTAHMPRLRSPALLTPSLAPPCCSPPGRLRPRATPPGQPTQTSPSTQSTLCPCWSSASTT